MVYARREGSKPLSANDLDAVVRVVDPKSPFEVLPVDATFAERVRSVPREPNADTRNRLLLAAAAALGASMITAARQVPAMTSARVIC